VSPNRQVGLSVVIVNYNVAPLVLQAVASLERQKFAGPDGSEGGLDIIVIDNASRPDDIACLDQLPSAVVQLRNDRNLGFAQATNQGIERASGRYLCFFNPDTTLLDGALDALLQHLYRHPEIGAVGPRMWADEERTLLLPPGDPPTLSFLLSGLLGSAIRTIADYRSRAWHRRAIIYWRSRTPVSVAMLSGACIVTPRAVVDRVGGFDPRYFLYYEDADWCRRVRRSGYQLVCVPEAEIVHYYNQSGKQDPQRARGHGLRSRSLFVGAQYGRVGRLIYRAAGAFSDQLARRRAISAPEGMIDLGLRADPPLLHVAAADPVRELVMQIGFDRCFIPSGAAFLRTAEFQLSRSTWDRMQPGRYYARMLDPETLNPLALWTWEKA
jgi:GT2 family glycosyltransferase